MSIYLRWPPFSPVFLIKLCQVDSMCDCSIPRLSHDCKKRIPTVNTCCGTSCWPTRSVLSPQAHVMWERQKEFCIGQQLRMKHRVSYEKHCELAVPGNTFSSQIQSTYTHKVRKWPSLPWEVCKDSRSLVSFWARLGQIRKVETQKSLFRPWISITNSYLPYSERCWWHDSSQVPCGRHWGGALHDAHEWGRLNAQRDLLGVKRSHRSNSESTEDNSVWV